MTTINPSHMNGVQTADSQNPIKDHSGVNSTEYINPYDDLLQPDKASSQLKDNIQNAYQLHRRGRNGQKKLEVLDPGFKGFVIDPILSAILDPNRPDYLDPRNSLVFWARPPPQVLALALQIQTSLKKVIPELWLMPIKDMHTTVLEVTHSEPLSYVLSLAKQLAPIIPELIALPTTTHGCRLVKPFITFDAAGVALSFVPQSQMLAKGRMQHLVPTIHHLRRELWQRITNREVPIESRYRVPTAHITLARFVSAGTTKDTSVLPAVEEQYFKCSRENIKEFMDKIERLNEGLEDDMTVWELKDELVCRVGDLWYGGGWTVDPKNPMAGFLGA